MVPFSIVVDDDETLLHVIHRLALDVTFVAAGVQILAELFLVMIFSPWSLDFPR
jgi:hypothetical protein